MAVIFEEALKQSLKRGLLPVYILFGEDAYLKMKYLKQISSAIAEEDDVFNYAKFSGNCDLQELYDAVMQMPLMNDRKCVILNDFDYLHCDPTALERLTEIVSTVPSETTLILYFDGIEVDHKKNAKFKKLMTACEKNKGVAVQLNHLTRSGLVKMLSDGANKRGCKMDSSAAGYLVDTAGEDINLLRNELDKLCAFVGEGTISKEHIDAVCTKTVEANIYNLADFIINCKSTEALNLLDDMFFTKIEPIAVLYNVAGVFNDMYRVYSAKAKNIPLSQVAETFGYGNRAFVLEKAERKLRGLDHNKLSLCLETLLKTDTLIKTFGANQRAVIEEMVVKLIYIISRGEALD